MPRKRRERTLRGQLEISKTSFNKFCADHKRFDPYREDWSYKNEDSPIYIPVRRFRLEELKALSKIMSNVMPRQSATIAQINAHIDVIENPMKKKIGKLPELESALLAYVRKDIIEGWVFSMDSKTSVNQAMLVTDVQYHPPEAGKGFFIPAKTVMSLQHWEKGEKQETSIRWHMDDLGEKTVAELLIEEGIVKENKELIEQYEKHEKQFLEWRKSMGKQFIGEGTFTQIQENNWGDKEFDSDMKGVRVVVDDRVDDIENRRQTSIFRVEEDDWEEEAAIDPEKADRYTRVPLGFYIWVFNLDSHRGGHVHINHMKPYVYRPEIRNNLILPAEHEDLIDALTGDMDVLMEDIVSGKSGGTTIICQGPSGTGKTLTAEVFAEVVKRPLYRVHSGQLGIDAEGVENELKEAMSRAKRWGAVMLIDEADVFVMQRGASLELNAVCGVFLRVLEYFDGLLFLTTNRLDAIDDAILSRCIAHITFRVPDEDERTKLWKSLGQVFNLKLTKVTKTNVPAQLARLFPKATGRDIKGLIRLTIKYARRRKKEVTLDDLKRFAPYRGL